MKKNTLKISGLLLALTLITSTFAGGTFAKYTTTVSGTDSATAKTFVFGVKEGDTALGNAEICEFFTGDGKVVPGDSGVFELTLTNSSEIPVEIVFNPTLERNIQPIKYAVTDTEAAPADYALNDASGLKSALDTALGGTAGATVGMDAGEEKTIYVQWKWIENDATDLNYQGLVDNLSISVTANQIVATK